MRRTATLNVWAATIDVYFSLIEIHQNVLPPKVTDNTVQQFHNWFFCPPQVAYYLLGITLIFVALHYPQQQQAQAVQVAVAVAAAAAAAAPQPNQPLVQWEIEANTLNLQGDQRLLYQLLREFHNFNREQCAKIRAEGYSSLSDLVNWKYKDIRSLLENLSNRPITRGDQQFCDRKIKELQALSWFVTDRNR